MEREVRTGPLQVFLLLGIIISGFLVYHHSALHYGFQKGPSFCALSPTFDCDKVASSDYSFIFGLPVASIALGYYLFFFFALLFLKKKLGIETISNVSLFLSALSLVPTAYLLVVSALVLQTFCLYCIALDCVNVILFVISLRFSHQLRRGEENFLRRSLQGVQAMLQKTCVFSALLLLLSSSLAFSASHYLKSHFSVSEKEREAAFTEYQKIWIKEWYGQSAIDFQPVRGGSLLDMDFYKGDVGAPITIIEFADFECPACRRASVVLNDYVSNNSQKVKLIFKQYPLDASCNARMTASHHQVACFAAKSVRCAGQKGIDNFWLMHDGIFSLSAVTEQAILSFAEEMGLDAAELSACITSEQVQQRVQEDIALGDKLGLTSTPSLFIFYEGRIKKVLSPDLLPTVVDALLAKR